jgi:hypothetical protein
MTGRTGRIIQGPKLREILGDKLWTLSDLSAHAHVSYRTVKYMVSEHPRVYTPAVVHAVAQALGRDVDDFSTPNYTAEQLAEQVA